MTHLGVMMLFAACVSAVFGTLLREAARDQLILAARIFGVLVAGAFVAGWLLYFLF